MNIFGDNGIEVELKDSNAFHKIVEVLSRIGILSRATNTLFQTCHILHKTDSLTDKSRYVIIHFKELMELDGLTTNLSQEDIERRNRIAFLLESWGMLSILDKDISANASMKVHFTVIKRTDKNRYRLSKKYKMGLNRNVKHRQ